MHKYQLIALCTISSINNTNHAVSLMRHMRDVTSINFMKPACIVKVCGERGEGWTRHHDLAPFFLTLSSVCMCVCSARFCFDSCEISSPNVSIFS